MRFPNMQPGSKYIWMYLIPLLASCFFFKDLGLRPFWSDELQTLNLMSVDRFEFAKNHYLTNQNHPPLYFLILKAFLWCCSYLYNLNKVIVIDLLVLIRNFSPVMANLINTSEILTKILLSNLSQGLYEVSEFTLRFPSAIAMSVLNIVGFHKLRKYFGLLAATFFVLLITGNQFVNNAAQDAKPYAMLYLFTFWQFLELYELRKTTYNFKTYRKIFLAMGLGILTHFYGLIFAISSLIILAVINIKHKKAALSFAVLSFLLIGVALYFINNADLSPLKFLQTLNLEKAFREILFLGIQNISYSTLLAGFIVVLTVLYIYRKTELSKIACLAIITVALLMALVMGLSEYRAIYNSRYLEFLTPLKILIILAGLWQLPSLLFGFLKNEKLKFWSGEIILLSICAFMVASQWANESVLENYRINSVSGDFPIDRAYQAMKNDAKTSVAKYISNRSKILPNYYYDKKYNVKNILSIPENLTGETLKNYVIDFLKNNPNEVFYYLRIKPRLSATEVVDVIDQIENYQKEIVFSEQRFVLIRFTKKQ